MVSSSDLEQRMIESFARVQDLDTNWEWGRQSSPEDVRDKLAWNIFSNLIFPIFRAREARELGVSHRNFKVGACAVALSYVDRRSYLISGFNAKPGPESLTNIHAEHIILAGAKKLGVDAVKLLVVVGDVQPDQQSGMDTPTLHPCGVCRERFAQDGSMVNEETLIISARPDLHTFEWFTVDALKKFHDNGDRSNIGHVEFTERLGLLDPYVQPTLAGHIDLRSLDTDEAVNEDRLFQQKFVLPVIDYAAKNGVLPTAMHR